MVDDRTPPSDDRVALLADGLMARFDGRALAIASDQRDMADGETRAVWAAIADRIAAEQGSSDGL